MKAFIAYFDLLGFEQFIELNNEEEQQKVLENIFHIMEFSLANGEIEFSPLGVVAKTSLAKVNCLNFSDTFVFWTKDNLETSFLDLMKVVSHFNSSMIMHVFPIRGTITYGDIFTARHFEKSENQTSYNVNSVYGKGIIDAYKKSNAQNWAGTVIDNELIIALNDLCISIDTCIIPFAKKYNIPYKESSNQPAIEYALNIVKEPIDEIVFNNYKDSIKQNFSDYKKEVSSSAVTLKITNTIKFLESFRSDL
ncbi:MAG: hypothetical protein WC150_08110 [Bacteroidia bacterium]